MHRRSIHRVVQMALPGGIQRLLREPFLSPHPKSSTLSYLHSNLSLFISFTFKLLSLFFYYTTSLLSPSTPLSPSSTCLSFPASLSSHLLYPPTLSFSYLISPLSSNSHRTRRLLTSALLSSQLLSPSGSPSSIFTATVS